jgi:hypothetical protein
MVVFTGGVGSIATRAGGVCSVAGPEGSGVVDHEDFLCHGGRVLEERHVFELARSGRPDAAVALISELQRRSTIQYVPRYAFALICAGLGRGDDALGYLEEAHRERSPALALWLGGEPRLDGLRPHRRFRDIAEHVGVA